MKTHRRARPLPIVTTSVCLLIVAGSVLPLVGVPLEALWLVPERFSLWAPLTSCFLHISTPHLAGNLLWLMVFGTLLEGAVRRYEYLLVLVGGGIAASSVQAGVVLISQPERAGSPIMGASGMVAAVIGAFAVRFFAVDMPIGRLSVPSLWVIALWFIPQVVGAVRTLAEGGVGTVGYWGHLGGFVVGMVLALSLRMTRAGARTYLSQQLVAAQAQGDLLSALRIAQAWCQLEPESVQAHLAAARAAHSLGEDDTATPYYQRALVLSDLQNDVRGGVDILLEMHGHLLTVSLPADLTLRWSLRAAQVGYVQEALELLQRLADTAGGTAEGENALLQMARLTLQQLNQPDRTISLLQRFLKQYPHSSLTAYALELLRQARERAEEK